MASESSAIYPYTSQYTSTNIFYENVVKKDSEIRLQDAEVQRLLQNRDQQVTMHRESPQSNLLCPEQSNAVPVSPISGTSYQSETGSTEMSDERKLSLSDRGHICMTCFKGFRNKPQLTQHELVHNNVRKHVCSYCEKQFKQICHLNQHKRVHTGDRPYKCDIEGCDRSFAQLSNLNHHKKNHEDHVRRDVSRQFRCEVCDRSYATKNSLNTHIQKLHSNLKAMEGSVSNPVNSSMTHLPKKRKKKSDVYGGNSDFDGINFKSESKVSGDDDLPTQVKVKSRIGHKPGLTVRISTPPSKEERDLNRQAPRTTLPLPFTIPFERYHQGQGQDSFVSTFSDPITQLHNLGQGHLLQTQHSHLFSNIDNIHKSSNILSHNPSQQLHALNSDSGNNNDGQRDQAHLMSPITSHDLVLAEQRELMQLAVSQREPCNVISDNDHCQINQGISQNSSHLHSISNVPLLQQEQHVFSSNTLSRNHGNQHNQISQRVVRNDAPSHIAHHYPASSIISDSNQNVGSRHMFDSAFKVRNLRNNHDRFSHSQF